MIKSFKNKATKSLFLREFHKQIPEDLAQRALKKLWILHFATSLRDLEAPPSNALEALKGDRTGQYSIRINSKWRICFTWNQGNAYEVEIIDYH